MGSLASSSSSSSSIRGEWENLKVQRENVNLASEQIRCYSGLRGRPQLQIWPLTSGCWQRAAAAPWWPAGWWRTGDARRHRLPTSPANPEQRIKIEKEMKTGSWVFIKFAFHLCVNRKPKPRRDTISRGQKQNWPSGSRPAWRLWWSRWWRWWRLWTQIRLINNMQMLRKSSRRNLPPEKPEIQTEQKVTSERLLTKIWIHLHIFNTRQA